MRHIHFLLLIICLLACGKKKVKEEDETDTAQIQTPVFVTTVSRGPLIEYIDLNATTAFLQKNYVKANINGYVQSVYTQPGKFVTKGQLLFVLKTKEAEVIGNAVNRLNPSFKFSGVNYIKASRSGYISQLNHQVGDYVQDGEQLAVINDIESFAFVMDLPYELKPYLSKNRTVVVTLPDSTRMQGLISAPLPTVDPNAQTQNIVIKVSNPQSVPESLIAKVRLIKAEKMNTQAVAKAAVLTNDVQSEYWVMKMMDSVTAVKTPIKKGIETQDKIEILSPDFLPGDRILLTGNFGLPDTAKVKITGQAK